MQTGAVVYAKDTEKLRAFYAAVVGFAVTHVEPEYSILESATFQLVLLAIPPHRAADVVIAEPPLRRENTAIKLVFFVPSIAEARAAAAMNGGALNPPEREWRFRNHVVCDGYDPEGNVIQLRAHVDSAHTDAQ